MTYSIVARDPDTGELGVAMATRWPGAGAIVPWVEPGVGAVATQSFTNVDLGPGGLAAMRSGLRAPAVLRDLLANDPQPERRQVALVDAEGRVAVHTGSGCVAMAGHLCGEGVSVQGNMLERSEVWSSMLEAFRAAKGDLAERLLAAVQAGDAAGGDVRGRGSAALLVAPADSGAKPWDRRFDLRVDEAPDPVGELSRLLLVARAHEALEAAITAGERGDTTSALAGTTAAYELTPDDAHIAYWHALALAATGQLDEARSCYAAALRSEPRLERFGSSYVAAGRGVGFVQAMEDLREHD